MHEMITPEGEPRRPTLGDLAPETSLALALLQHGQPDDVFTPADMAAQIGLPCNGSAERGFRYVAAAIRLAIRRYSVVWQWSRDRKVWVCLDDPQKVQAARNQEFRRNRANRRALRIGVLVNRSNLNDAERAEHSLTMLTAAMCEKVGGSKFRKRLAAEEGTLTQPDPTKLIDLMRS